MVKIVYILIKNKTVDDTNEEIRNRKSRQIGLAKETKQKDKHWQTTPHRKQKNYQHINLGQTHVPR